MSHEFTEGTQTVPASALRMVAEACVQFAASAPDSDGTYPVSVLARSAQPILHPYWGKIAHDMDGVTYGEQVHADYCHNTADVIGYFDELSAGPDGLKASGKLIPFDDRDRASEVLHKQKRGMKYQASIDFSEAEPVLEWVPVGSSSDVNGYTLEGPAVIVRQWRLSAIAICPRGADGNTSTKFDSGSDFYPVTLWRAEAMAKKTVAGSRQMSTDAVAADPVEEPKVEEVVDPTEVVEEVVDTPAEPPVQLSPEKLELKRYVTAFGADGAQFYLDGKPFEECREVQVSQLKAKVETLEAEIATLNKRLSAASSAGGHSSPLPVGAVKSDTGRKPFFKNLPSANHN